MEVSVMPTDNRDFRVRIDLDFDPANEGVARGLFNHAVAQIAKAVNINPGSDSQEIGYVSLERCGHRIGEPCEVTEREEVP